MTSIPLASIRFILLTFSRFLNARAGQEGDGYAARNEIILGHYAPIEPRCQWNELSEVEEKIQPLALGLPDG